MLMLIQNLSMSIFKLFSNEPKISLEVSKNPHARIVHYVLFSFAKESDIAWSRQEQNLDCINIDEEFQMCILASLDKYE